ncbi:hypothetical protein [Amycolatopsis silviterrae]|uniref:Uncharacterized protein n=1 Tax=Amycolatopsis silviterrae TaxID=1656914 RepID=A0ABW5HH95_9PSEU
MLILTGTGDAWTSGTVFADTHFRSGAVAGDGQHLVYQELLGLNRAARRLTHAVVQRPWQRRLVDDLAFGRAHHLLTS